MILNSIEDLLDELTQMSDDDAITFAADGKDGRQFTVIRRETFDQMLSGLRVGNAIAALAAQPTPDLVVWNVRTGELPDAVRQEYQQLVDVECGAPVRLISSGAAWTAVPVHIVIGDRYLVAKVAEELDVDAVRLWVGGEPAQLDESEGSWERSFAVVFAEQRTLRAEPGISAAGHPGSVEVPDLMKALEDSVKKALEDSRARRAERRAEAAWVEAATAGLVPAEDWGGTDD